MDFEKAFRKHYYSGLAAHKVLVIDLEIWEGHRQLDRMISFVHLSLPLTSSIRIICQVMINSMSQRPN